MNRNTRNLVVYMGILSGLLIFLGAPTDIFAQIYEFKISVETVPNHPRNKGLEMFMQEIKKRSGGRLAPRLYHSGQLYKDAHVVKAVKLGNVEMAVPGTWLLEGFDPNATLTMLPMFFGRPGEVTEKVIDGKFGKFLSNSMEKKIGIKTLGRYYELGHVHCFTRGQPIKELKDFKGLRIRVPGGKIPASIYGGLGARGVFVALPDVSMALVQGTVDGIETSLKTVESAKYYEAGIKYAILIRSWNAYYLPMVSSKFWSNLPADLQKLMTEAWNSLVPEQREIARREQIEAQKILQNKGVEIFAPSNEELEKLRKHILPLQNQLVKDIKQDVELVKLAMDELGILNP